MKMRALSLNRSWYALAACSLGAALVISSRPATAQRPQNTAPADLIIEVLSPYETQRRQQEKLDDYESIAAPEVWLIDSKMRSVRVHLLNSGKFVPREVTSGPLEPTRFPGVSIPVSEIWPR